MTDSRPLKEQWIQSMIKTSVLARSLVDETNKYAKKIIFKQLQKAVEEYKIACDKYFKQE